MPLTMDFDPIVNGWNFQNWEASSFDWDLFRDAYLGINPTHDCVQAPLDCAFFEIFKNCAQGGNCGGMSLLSLALFKYGGFMGFARRRDFTPARTDRTVPICTAPSTFSRRGSSALAGSRIS